MDQIKEIDLSTSIAVLGLSNDLVVQLGRLSKPDIDSLLQKPRTPGEDHFSCVVRNGLNDEQLLELQSKLEVQGIFVRLPQVV